MLPEVDFRRLRHRAPLLCLLVFVDLERRFVGRAGETLVAYFLKPLLERSVAKTLPALLGVMDGDNDAITVIGRSGDVNRLALRKIGPVTRMNFCERRLVLILGAALEEVNDPVGHVTLPFSDYVPAQFYASRAQATSVSQGRSCLAAGIRPLTTPVPAPTPDR
jgi:hypothetical protein